jgi:hypothetical protein
MRLGEARASAKISASRLARLTPRPTLITLSRVGGTRRRVRRHGGRRHGIHLLCGRRHGGRRLYCQQPDGRGQDGKQLGRRLPAQPPPARLLTALHLTSLRHGGLISAAGKAADGTAAGSPRRAGPARRSPPGAGPGPTSARGRFSASSPAAATLTRRRLRRRGRRGGCWWWATLALQPGPLAPRGPHVDPADGSARGALPPRHGPAKLEAERYYRKSSWRRAEDQALASRAGGPGSRVPAGQVARGRTRRAVIQAGASEGMRPVGI